MASLRRCGNPTHMDRLPFCFVDVFSDRPLEGNPLAVVPDADSIDEATMRRIAREFNQSETTFLLKPAEDDADWHLRSFTAAGHEVTGAGHNALGAWWWLAVAGRLPLHDGANAFRQKLAGRVLPLQVVSSGGAVRSIVMQHAAPEFGETVSDARALADALGLDAGELLPEGRAAQVVSTGAGHLLIPVRDRSAIDRAKPDAARLFSILRASGGEGAYLLSLLPRCGSRWIGCACAVLQSDDGDQRRCGDGDRGGAAGSVAGERRSGPRGQHTDRAGLHDGAAKFDRNRGEQ
jgi:trans-2,3-dihydro-3-hydroxyanthranilate isomerase